MVRCAGADFPFELPRFSVFLTLGMLLYWAVRQQIFRGLRLAGNGDGAAPERILRELAAIGMRARECEEYIVFPNASRVIVKPRGVPLGKLRREWLLEPHARE